MCNWTGEEYGSYEDFSAYDDYVAEPEYIDWGDAPADGDNDLAYRLYCEVRAAMWLEDQHIENFNVVPRNDLTLTPSIFETWQPFIGQSVYVEDHDFWGVITSAGAFGVIVESLFGYVECAWSDVRFLDVAMYDALDKAADRVYGPIC